MEQAVSDFLVRGDAAGERREHVRLCVRVPRSRHALTSFRRVSSLSAAERERGDDDVAAALKGRDDRVPEFIDRVIKGAMVSVAVGRLKDDDVGF